MTMIANEELQELDSKLDPYRCPVCDVSVLRSDEIPPDRRPGIYRDGYLGLWFACPVHGIIQPKYDENRVRVTYSDDDGAEWGEIHSDAIDLLVEYQQRCIDPDCELCLKTREYLKPILATLHEEAMAAHCGDVKHPEAQVSGERGRCAVCGRYWQRFDGIWFRGGRPGGNRMEP